jgi:hypothetical protein
MSQRSRRHCPEPRLGPSARNLVAVLTELIFLYLWLYSPLNRGQFFSFLILYTVGKTPWTGDQPVARPLPTHRTSQTQNKRTQTFMPGVGFEPTTPVFERAKTVHDLDRLATVIGKGKAVPVRDR